MVRLAGALPVLLPAQATPSLAKETKLRPVGAPAVPLEERAKSTVVLVKVVASAVMPAPEPFGRVMLEAEPVLVLAMIVLVGFVGSVASQLYRCGRVEPVPRKVL